MERNEQLCLEFNLADGFVDLSKPLLWNIILLESSCEEVSEHK